MTDTDVVLNAPLPMNGEGNDDDLIPEPYANLRLHEHHQGLCGSEDEKNDESTDVNDDNGSSDENNSGYEGSSGYDDISSNEGSSSDDDSSGDYVEDDAQSSGVTGGDQTVDETDDGDYYINVIDDDSDGVHSGVTDDGNSMTIM
ncbi:hypothetical protein SeLEV6574_g06645 [Synchytrium endobioticum]|uniref:Uncharacterized protein n=1 Tax=Synchytrium endobioticum TaxID=286115 RepID=A0A507CMX6_9FUNG|nr:hypothetical protein SeLEV6574_g06645 [Synchytrium endobioticum]